MVTQEFHARTLTSEIQIDSKIPMQDHRDAMLKKQQSQGVDIHSQAVDPMFVDPDNGDFRFSPDSPALRLGIVPFDGSKVGLLK